VHARRLHATIEERRMGTATDSYTSKRAKYFQARRGEVLEFVPRSASNIVEFGCGAGVFSSQIKSRQKARVVGVELMPEPANQARAHLDHVFQCNIEHGLDFLAGESFDCAIFIDVLEHLASPWTALRELKKYMAPGGIVVASIPNIRYYEVVKMLLFERRFRYADEGVMDRTHLRFFTHDDIVDLFEGESYSVKRIQGLNGQFTWKIRLLNTLLLGALSDTEHKQFVVVATLK
jgi:2-polyprenyl-3-methyl-5-hydroxy-6-metoxy-1,4-benzoquinol methylase